MSKKNSLGLWTLTALVAGNMIGSGIFLLPANLASLGSISLLSWGFTALGAFFLALMFARMGYMIPKTGGPYAYARLGLGNFIGFQTAYSYWIAIWTGNAAIALAATGYASVFWPSLAEPFTAALVAIGIIWALTAINILGIREAGVVQLFSTILKIIPLGVIAFMGWKYFHPDYLNLAYNVSGESNFSALSQGAALTLWAFIGVESATIPADSVENPTRTIPLATLFGTLIATLVYIVSSVVIMGMIPHEALMHSPSPFADAADIIFGSDGKSMVALGAVISCVGCLNGWVLLQGQVAMAAARDGLFPAIFAKLNRKKVPFVGLIIASLLISLLLLLTVSDTLVKSFYVIILLTVLASLIPYLYTAIAAIVLYKQSDIPTSWIHTFIAILAFLYSCWAIFGIGKTYIQYGALLLLSAIPLYAFFKKRADDAV